jgi:Domain of unknown function (DUF305)
MLHRTERRMACIAAVLGLVAASIAAAGPARRVLAAASQYPLCAGPAQAGASDERAFLAANAAAMTRMMTDMAIRPAGDVDHDFVEAMVPHHRGAMEMAQAELRYGRDERLRRMAQEIIVTQQQEIAAMRLALGQPLPPSVAAPDQVFSERQPDAKPN